MTTDKTPATLATVKPGGCVKLGGSASQIDADTLWWLQDAANTLAEGGNESHAAKLHELHAALSAQPSPGGQGDANSPLSVYADSYRRMAKMGDGRVSCIDVAFDIEHNMSRALAARQPVGDEERAETYRKGWEAGNAAQAVDLGQFRRPIEEWRSDMGKWVEEHGDYDGVFAKDIAEANRLLALIDSQDSSNG